mmetsp:Transcript_41728/g.130717  ORF Transcript_41728/g.130717 Transcript_41728/m.130717 type:complete len:352 (-) Transcript_41728:188-1243(-)
MASFGFWKDRLNACTTVGFLSLFFTLKAAGAFHVPVLRRPDCVVADAGLDAAPFFSPGVTAGVVTATAFFVAFGCRDFLDFAPLSAALSCFAVFGAKDSARAAEDDGLYLDSPMLFCAEKAFSWALAKLTRRAERGVLPRFRTARGFDVELVSDWSLSTASSMSAIDVAAAASSAFSAGRRRFTDAGWDLSAVLGVFAGVRVRFPPTNGDLVELPGAGAGAATAGSVSAGGRSKETFGLGSSSAGVSATSSSSSSGAVITNSMSSPSGDVSAAGSATSSFSAFRAFSSGAWYSAGTWARPPSSSSAKALAASRRSPSVTTGAPPPTAAHTTASASLRSSPSLPRHAEATRQ